MSLSPAGRALVIVFVITGVGLLVQLIYVLWYRRRFWRRSAGDSELASIISDRSGTPASKEMALYYLYYRNQPPSELEPPAAAATPAVPNDSNAEAERASTYQTRVRVATAATLEAPTLSMRPPVPEAAAAASTEGEEEEEKHEPGSPEDMMCPSFSGLVRDFTTDDERDERTSSASASASASAGGARSTSARKDTGRHDPTPFGTPTNSPPFVSPVASPMRDILEFKRYANKVARRVALPS